MPQINITILKGQMAVKPRGPSHGREVGLLRAEQEEEAAGVDSPRRAGAEAECPLGVQALPPCQEERLARGLRDQGRRRVSALGLHPSLRDLCLEAQCPAPSVPSRAF